MTTNSNLSFIFSVYGTCIHTYICTFWYNTFASILPLLNSIMQCSNIWESDTVFFLSSFSFSTVHINIFSLTLHFTVRYISGLCSLLHITFLIHSSPIILFLSHISVLLLFISLYLCHYRLCLVLFHSFPHIVIFDMFINLCMYSTSFCSLPVLLCSTNPLTIFLSLASLPSACEAGITYGPSLHHFFTVTNIPSFCSVVHFSSFSVHASFELLTAVLPESDLLGTKHSITSQGSSLFTFKLHYTSISWVLYSLSSETFLTFIVSLSALQSSSTWCCDLGHYMHALCLTSL